MERYYHKVSSKHPKPSSTTPDSTDLGERTNESEQHRQNEGIDLNSLPKDPGERLAIRKYHPNDHDATRRSCIHQDENINQGGGEVFSSIGFTCWNKKKSFNEHIGGPNSAHNQSRRNAKDLMRQKQSIQSVLAKQSDQQKLEYQTHLESAIDVIRYRLNQGLSFRGHREDESSFNKGKWLSVLDLKARLLVTSEDLRYLAVVVLVGVFSLSKPKKEVYKRRRLSDMTKFSDQRLVRKEFQRSLCEERLEEDEGKVSGIRVFTGLEWAMIAFMSKGLYCFDECLWDLLIAELTLVAISRRCNEVQELSSLVSDILNMVAAFFKLRDELLESQGKEIEEALCKGELETSRGLN
ncbi:uncharacterized protein LOC132607694 [Lycium barbarum]|uniref:uncharacterized protein LOC132607694 n=1 Tax=Lycium barbarum TaxID=112863 RepID=UPI00293F7621|nr:uncharacterized protein LOC132607694 [Lycium barbarum]